jgi:hypothetical protein
MTKRKSVSVLRQCLGLQRVNSRYIPFHSLLIDWRKAMSEDAIPRGTPNCDWKTFLKIGFNKERLLKCIDPAIVYIVERLYDLGIITTYSCSGHTSDRNSAPYIVMIFPDSNIGKSFIRNLRILFRNINHTLVIQGDQHYIFGPFGPELPVVTCLKYQLPINISWKMKKINDAEELGLVWTTFMNVIDQIDHLGIDRIPEELFAETHEDMMQSLINDVKEELGLKK